MAVIVQKSQQPKTTGERGTRATLSECNSKISFISHVDQQPYKQRVIERTTVRCDRVLTTELSGRRGWNSGSRSEIIRKESGRRNVLCCLHVRANTCEEHWRGDVTYWGQERCFLRRLVFDKRLNGRLYCLCLKYLDTDKHMLISP